MPDVVADFVNKLGEIASRVLGEQLPIDPIWQPLFILVIGYFAMYYFIREELKELDSFDKLLWSMLLGFPLYLYFALILLFIHPLLSLRISLSILNAFISLAFMVIVGVISLRDVRQIMLDHVDSPRDLYTRIKIVIKFIPIIVTILLAEVISSPNMLQMVLLLFASVAMIIIAVPIFWIRSKEKRTTNVIDAIDAIRSRDIGRIISMSISRIELYSHPFRFIIVSFFGLDFRKKDIWVLPAYFLLIYSPLIMFYGLKVVPIYEYKIVLANILLLPFTLYWLYEVLRNSWSSSGTLKELSL